MICVLIFISAAQAQLTDDVHFDRLTSENQVLVKGLSQNWVYSMVQDRYGYIWLGTWDGLNKFNGYDFTIYNENNGLSDHTIWSLLEDKDGNLWVGTNDGLNILDRKTQMFLSYNPPIDTQNIYSNRINDIIQSHDGMIWIGTGAGLFKFEVETQTFTNYISTGKLYDSPRSSYILNLFEDDHGIIWVSTTYGLVKFDPKTERSTRYYHIEGDSNSISNNNVRYVIQEKSGNFWIGTRKGLNHYDTTSQTIRQYFNDPADPNSLSDDWIRVVYEDKLGHIWIGTDAGGLNIYNPDQDNFIRFSSHFNQPSSLSNNRIYSILEDNTGNIWVGTYKGVNKINQYSNEFKCFKQGLDSAGLINNNIWDFFEDENKVLWIATSGGVNRYDPSAGMYTSMQHESGNANSLMDNEIRTMLYTPQLNCIWFGLFGSGVDQYDLITRKFKHFVPEIDKNSLSDVYINDLLCDQNNIIWIATGRGLNRYDPVSGKFKVFKYERTDQQSLSNNIIISLFKDSHNNIWVGTDDGLNKMDNETQKFTRYFNTDEYPLINRTVFYITEDHSGNIWFGTSGGGLVRFNPESLDYKIYTTENGLPNNIVYGIEEDINHDLWLSTNMGLVRFSVVNEHFVNYDVKDGIQSYEFNLGACYKDENGVMYFGGINGFNCFDPKSIKTNPNNPVIVISAFRTFNEKYPFELLDGDTVILSHDDNFFSFEIAALDYINPAKNKYKYYLENVDKDWITTTADNRIAEYKKVRPGTYTFYTKGSNNDGVWNEKGLSVTVIIKPPWYQTWFFMISVFGMVVFIIWFLISRRIRNIRNKNLVERKMLEIEKQKFELEQKALQLQMNPHFIFNSLNSIQSYILNHDTQMAVMYLGKFSQLMRLILSGSANKLVPFTDELKAIQYYLDLERLRFNNKFEYSIIVDKEIDKEYIEIPPMLIEPYIENAIIHGILQSPRPGKIDIGFTKGKNKLRCVITDNGIGREQAAEIRKQAGIMHRPSGMHITQARLEMLRNEDKSEEHLVKIFDLKDESGKPEGTSVELIILLNDE